jgi:hypothetical protein
MDNRAALIESTAVSHIPRNFTASALALELHLPGAVDILQGVISSIMKTTRGNARPPA